MCGRLLPVVAWVLLVASCARTPAPGPTTPHSEAVDLAGLAALIDDSSAAPLWPLVPPDVKALVAARIPASLTASERLRLGTDWLQAGAWLERCERPKASEGFVTFLAGYKLIEELAWSVNAAQASKARAVLYDCYRDECSPVPFRPELDQLTAAVVGMAKKHSGQDLEAICQGPFTTLLTQRGAAIQKHLAAEILRDPTSPHVPRVLRDRAERLARAGDFARALPLYEEAARRLPFDGEAWLDLARTYYRVDRLAAGDDALAKGAALPRDGDGKPLADARRLRELARRLADPASAGPAQASDRFWTLFAMNRLSQARTVINELRRQRPRDAHGLLGDAWLRYFEHLTATGDPIGAVDRAYVVLVEARDVEGRDADYFRFFLALAYQSELGPLTSNLPASMEAAIQRVRQVCAQVAPLAPGEAAAYSFALDMLILQSERQDEAQRRARLAQLFPRAVDLHRAHPSPASYRILISLAPLHGDRNQAFDVLVARPRFGPHDDEDILLARARAYLSVALRWRDVDRLQAIAKVLDDIPRSSVATERKIATLRGDALALRAFHSDPSLWKSAFEQYAAANEGPGGDDNVRAANNAAAIADMLLTSDDGTTATIWDRLSGEFPPPWPVLVNGAAAALQDSGSREALAILRSRAVKSEDDRPEFVKGWLACLAGNRGRHPATSVPSETSPAITILTGADATDSTSEAYDFRYDGRMTLPPRMPDLRVSIVFRPWLVASARRCAGSSR